MSNRYPELERARVEGQALLVAQLIAHVGNSALAEDLLERLQPLIAGCADFRPDLPPESRERAVRRAALTCLIELAETPSVDVARILDRLRKG